jgi:hypothetical protein
MRTVKIRMRGADLSREMAAMREWLDRNSCEPTRFKYDQEEDAVVVSIDFPTDAFASRFVAEHELQGSAPSAGDSARQPAK